MSNLEDILVWFLNAFEQEDSDDEYLKEAELFEKAWGIINRKKLSLETIKQLAAMDSQFQWFFEKLVVGYIEQDKIAAEQAENSHRTLDNFYKEGKPTLDAMYYALENEAPWSGWEVEEMREAFNNFVEVWNRFFPKNNGT